MYKSVVAPFRTEGPGDSTARLTSTSFAMYVASRSISLSRLVTKPGGWGTPIWNGRGCSSSLLGV